MFQPPQFRPTLVCEPCWITVDWALSKFDHPTQHPKAVYIPNVDEVICHRMVGFGNDGIETVCGQRWTNAGLTATFTGA